MYAMFPWPAKERLWIEVTKYYLIAPVFENKGINDGTLVIYSNYMEDQYQLKVNDER